MATYTWENGEVVRKLSASPPSLQEQHNKRTRDMIKDYLTKQKSDKKISDPIKGDVILNSIKYFEEKHPIIALALRRNCEEFCDRRGVPEDIRKIKIKTTATNMFSFKTSREGSTVWWDVNRGNLDSFYEYYAHPKNIDETKEFIQYINKVYFHGSDILNLSAFYADIYQHIREDYIYSKESDNKKKKILLI